MKSHGPAAEYVAVTVGAPFTGTVISASSQARPVQKNVGSVSFGTNFNLPGVVASAALKRIGLAPVAEFQKPATCPSTDFIPGIVTLFVSPKQVTSIRSVFVDSVQLFKLNTSTGVVPAGSYMTDPLRPLRIMVRSEERRVGKECG